jgi:hypothetical protein
MPRDDQVAFYRWLIDQLKIGGCDEIKFVNFGYTPQGGPAQINLQTTESVRLARSGKLRPSKSPESHLGHVHISFETANTHKTDGTLRQFLTHMEGGEKMSDDPDPMKSETVCPKDIAEKYGLLPGTKSTFERVLWATYGAVLAILNTIKKK